MNPHYSQSANLGYHHPGYPNPNSTYPGHPAYPYPIPARLHPARSAATWAIWLALLGGFAFPVTQILVLVLARHANRLGYPGVRAKAAVVITVLDLLITVGYLGAYLLIPDLRAQLLSQ